MGLRLAGDEQVEPAEVDRVLDQAGKTVDDLKEAIEVHVERARLHEKIKELEPATVEWRKFTAEIKAIDDKADEYQKQYDTKRQELDQQAIAARRRMDYAAKAKEMLRCSAAEALERPAPAESGCRASMGPPLFCGGIY